MRLRTQHTQRLPTAPGLVLDIPMFEGSGTKVLDLSGKGNHGTITDALWTRDENGVAMSFNGASAYIDCGNDPSLNITDAITIEAWVKRDSEKRHIILSDWVSVGGERVVFFEVQADNTLRLAISGDGAATATLSTTDTIDTNWNHLVTTFINTNAIIYINSVESKSSSAFPSSISSTQHNKYIGSYQGTAHFFKGTIDEGRIYAVALTASQTKRRYEQTKRDYVRGS